MSVAKWDGRGHHNTDSVYPLPNDIAEHDRLDKQAEAINAFMFGKPFHALERTLSGNQDSFKALDVGCGTGIITSLLGNAVRNIVGSKVYGLDFSPIPQDRHPNPGNVEYVSPVVLQQRRLRDLTVSRSKKTFPRLIAQMDVFSLPRSTTSSLAY